MGRPKKKSRNIPYRSFEDCIDIINICINKRRHRWTLTALPFMDFDDVAQIIRLHIFNKWHLYNQEKKLESWLTTVINHQMINIIRNVYSNHSRPCLKCPFFEGENLCSKFGTQNVNCDLYRAWVHGKKTKNQIQLPLSMENHQNEVSEVQNESIDIDKTAPNIHNRMQKILKPLEWIVYKGLFIDHKSEVEVAKSLGFKTSEKGRDPGYKQLNNIKRLIIVKVKQVLQNKEIEIVQY